MAFLSPYFFSFCLSGQRNLRGPQMLKKPNCSRAQVYLGSGAIAGDQKEKEVSYVAKE